MNNVTDFQARLFREARQRQPFSELTTWLIDPVNLANAWDRVRASEGAATPGPDGVCLTQIQSRHAAWLETLRKQLCDGVFAFAPPRVVQVPKANKPGQYRGIGILNLSDRVVHAAFKQVLEPLIDGMFLNTSFGFRPGRSVPGALDALIDKAKSMADEGTNSPIGLHLDVADCFDTIDIDALQLTLRQRISDPDFLNLLEALLLAGSRPRRAWFTTRRVGLVQGSVLSPLLCNLALHPVDLAIAAHPDVASGECRVLRYADDLFVLARRPSSAARLRSFIQGRLSKQGQRLRDVRAAAAPLSEGVDWLGVRIEARPSLDGTGRAYGYHVPCSKVRRCLEKLDALTAPPAEAVDPRAYRPDWWLRAINTQLRDWREAYQFADNAPEFFRVLDAHARQRVGELLRVLTGKRANSLRSGHLTRLPRGFVTWQVDGVALVVLSAMPPRAPAHLIRPPNWARRRRASKDTRDPAK